MSRTKAKKKDEKAMTSSSPLTKTLRTLPDLREDKVLWYKICVLTYDLRNVSKDRTSERRLLQTIDELYISEPYFSAEEAATIKALLVDSENTSLEQAVTTSLQNFFRLSFLLRSREGRIEDEKFVSWLRRSGLGKS